MGWILASLLSAQPGLPPQADWRIHATPHFAIYYTADVAAELGRVAPMAERAYLRISADLRSELSFKLTLVLYKTQAALEQSPTTAPGPPEHVLIALDRPDALAGRISHELTHVFQFHMWPRSIVSRVPTWVLEGLAEYERGRWTPSSLAQLRDAVLRDQLPSLTAMPAAGVAEPQLLESLGHAVFEFIEARYGKEGMRRFLLGLATANDPCREAFGVSADEFERAFNGYLRRRFGR